MKTTHKIQEWIADRVSWVQYPNIRPADQSTRNATRTGVQFVHAMPIGKRIDLVLLSLVGLLMGLAAMAVTGFLLYVVIGAIFSG